MSRFLDWHTLLFLAVATVWLSAEGDVGAEETSPVPPTVKLLGFVFSKVVESGETHPFLIVEDDSRTQVYRIETRTPDAEAELGKYKEWDKSEIEGVVTEVGLPTVFANVVRILPLETKSTASGAIFTRDNSAPELEIAWRDPSGMIWGDVIKDTEGKAKFLTQPEANDACQQIGAKLPTDRDFRRLRRYMGFTSGLSPRNYFPEILPHLTFSKASRLQGAYLFWSETPHWWWRDSVYYFIGHNGHIDASNKKIIGRFNARCVR